MSDKTPHLPGPPTAASHLDPVYSEAAAGTTGLSVISGGLWNSISQVLPQGFALAISVAAARYLGPDGMGRQSFIAFTMISLTQLIGEGLKEALMRSIGEALGADRPGAVRHLVRWGLPILLAGGLAGGAVLAAAGLLGASPMAAWLLAGLECLLIVAQGVPWALLTGSQKWRQASSVGLFCGMAGLPVTILVLAAGGGIVGMFAVEAITAGVSLVAVSILARRTMRALPRRSEDASELRRRTSGYAVLATLMALATFVVWQRSEFFFLSAYSTDREIAFYSIAFAAANGIALLPGALAGTLSAAFATLFGAREHARIRSGYWRAQRMLLVVSLPLLAVFAALGPALIRLAYGDSYGPAGPVLLILLSLFPLIPMLSVATSLLIGLGVLRVALACEVVGGLVTVLLNFLLVPDHAAVGAAIADVGGQVVVVIPVLIYASSQVGPASVDMPAVGRAVLASAPAGVAAWLLDSWLGGLAGLVVGAGAAAAVFGGLLVVLRIVPARDRAWVSTTVSSHFGARAARISNALVGPPGHTPLADPGAGAAGGMDGLQPPACRHLVVYSDATQRGGAERVLGYLIGALDPRIEVTVMGTEPAVVSWIASHRPAAAETIVPVVPNKWRVAPILAHIRAVRRLRPEVLHASLSSSWSCQYGILAGLLSRGTRVVAVENALVPSNQPFQRAIKRAISRRLAAHVAVSDWSAREIERLIGLTERSILTIDNGVPDTTPRPAGLERDGSSPTVTIGVISRIGPHKGIDLIVRALPDLPDVGAVIVGEGSELGAIRELARDLGAADRVQAVGFDPEPRRWLASFDVFVLPTETEAALPLAAIEAMLAGVPVITTSIGSIAESFPEGEAGLLVAPGDLPGLVEAVHRLSRDPALRERMGASARAFAVERFGVAAMVAAYEGLYREMVACAGAAERSR